MERDAVAGELAAKSRSLHRSEKRREACEQELNGARRENGAKIAVIAELQATGHSWANKVRRWCLPSVLAFPAGLTVTDPVCIHMNN